MGKIGDVWVWREAATEPLPLKWRIRVGPPPFPGREFGGARLELPGGRVYVRERDDVDQAEAGA